MTDRKMNDILLVIVSIFSSLIDSSEMNETKICENHIGNITCENPKIVLITNATYGRNDNTTCPHESLRNYNGSPCGSDQTDHFRSICQRKTVCSITPKNDVSGDPCPNIFKYLTVWFNCSEPFPSLTNGHSKPTSSSTSYSRPTSVSITSSETSTYSTTIPSSPNLDSESPSSVPNTKQDDSNLAGLVGGLVAAVVCIVIVAIIIIYRWWPHVINCKKNKNTTTYESPDYVGNQNVSYIQPTQESTSRIPAYSSLQTKSGINKHADMMTNEQHYSYASLGPDERSQTQQGKAQYDYADLSKDNGNSQSEFASNHSNVYHVLDPNETGFDRHQNNKTFAYDLAKPGSNISETEVYMTSNNGVYDRAQERRHKLQEDVNNLYSHGTDDVYDCAHDREHIIQEDVNNLYGHMVDGVYDSTSHCRSNNDNGVDYGAFL